MNILLDRDRYLEVLLRFPLFQDFKAEELREVLFLSKCEIREYGKDEIIHLQNEKCQLIDLIIDGKVIVQNINENGTILTINTFSNGDMIGANLIFSSRNIYPMTVTSSCRTTIVSLNREFVLKNCRRSESFMVGMLCEISNKTVILTDKINAISRKTIRKCILDFLNYEQALQGNNVIKLSISKKELAERLGIPRSSFGRELIKMKREGLVEYDIRTITMIKSEDTTD